MRSHSLKFSKGTLTFLLIFFGTVTLVGAALPASLQRQLGITAAVELIADAVYGKPSLPAAPEIENTSAFVPRAFMPGNPSADIDQCANDPMPSDPADGCSGNSTQWVNGNLGASKSVYREGDSIPYRLRFDNLSQSSHSVTIEWDTTKSSKHALDYITTVNKSVLDANPCLGVNGCISGSYHPFPLAPPNADPQVTGAGVTPLAGELRMYGGTISAISGYSYPNGSGFSGDKSARITITFTASRSNPVLAWGGHISTRKDWSEGGSAVAISGSPYHTRLIDLDGSGGNQDRSLSAAAVIFPSSITIIKDTVPDGPQDFAYTTSSNLNPSSFSLDDDANATLSNTQAYTNMLVAVGDTFTITETQVSGWDLSLANPPCIKGSDNGGSSSGNAATGTVTINLKEGENYTCKFTNTEDFNRTRGRIIVDKVTVPGKDSNPPVTDSTVFNFTSDFSGNFQLTDAGTPVNSGLIVPVNPNSSDGTYSVSETANAAYTTTSSCSDGSPVNAISLQAGETVTCTFVNTLKKPHLSITKVATETGFSKLNDVIHYTIVATNDGNIALNDVLVTDSQVSNLVCTPSNPVASLAVGATINCTASHSITQADLDAGKFYNQACVDDGNTGAAQACADVTTNGSKDPKLSITKDATEASYDAVNQVIHYTIVATNTGNVTLNVTVTDTEAVLGTCTPANGSSVAPGGSITCPATHSVTQADIDAGTYNNTACADDGAGGASQVCDDADVPAVKHPHLSITKDATETGFSKLNDVIHYTIVATNDGNVTLSNVLVTDSNVSDLSCTPSNPVASLAPKGTINCTATHTITQADLDAGTFYNQACVDDGTGGADSACDDVTTPGTQNPHLSITKVATETGFSKLNDVIHYTITVTNDGNVTLSNVTVSDPNAANLTCTPANGSSLAPTNVMTCTASHTITQADLDAGSYYNQACVDDGTGGAAQACDDVSTPGSKNPHLTITKDATETGFSKLGDVIHYSITATNDGNVTLSNVTVTDPKVTDLICTPSNPVASLAPGDSINCTASHTIDQSDLDLGSFYNQACVDDGADGAAEACDDVTTPGTKNPHLVIDKVATESGFSKAGDVIHYTITAKNDGNVTLNSVTVTDDPALDNFSCTPANGSNLAPGNSIVCTGTHTITQADVDLGSFYDQACVDDGAEGAAKACDDVTVPGSKNPHLAITKVATESGFSATGQVIHYTIVATNDGNVTLNNVTVTDPNVGNLSCSPSMPVASLSPGGTINCTASHTIVQADIDAGSFYNQACVDDGTAGAAKVCADVTTPGTQSPRLTLVKLTNGTDNNSAPGLLVPVGSAITWTYQVTNSGNVTLTNIAVTDNKLASSAIDCGGGSNVVASLAPGNSATCSASGTAIAGQYTNTGTAKSGTTTATDPDNYFGQTTNVSGSYPTQTTCQEFISNTIQPQEDGSYGVKSGKINNASPGVIFYYSRWTPGNSTAYIDQAVLAPPNFTRTLTVQSVSLFRAADCSAAPGTITSPFTVTVSGQVSDTNGIKLTGLQTTLEYVVAVKYSVSSIAGATAPSGGAAIKWQFQTRDNTFAIVAKDDNGFTLVKK